MIANIPKYRVNEIIKIYESCKHTFVNETRIRRSRFINILRAYYRWENKETICHMFDTIIQPREKKYMTTIHLKKIKKEYGAIVSELFSAIDKNDDGSIDLNEFKYAVKSLNNYIPYDLFDTADTNSDGILDKNEFYRIVASTPELRNNFDTIIKNTIHKNQEKEYKSRCRIFKNDITGRRPSLLDIRDINHICSIDVPLYDISLISHN